MDLTAGRRLHSLLQDGTFWQFHTELLVLSSGAYTSTGDLVASIKVGEQGRIVEKIREIAK